MHRQTKEELMALIDNGFNRGIFDDIIKDSIVNKGALCTETELQMDYADACFDKTFDGLHDMQMSAGKNII